MIEETSQALRDFSQRYCDLWQQQHGHAPASADLYGIPSPCVTATHNDEVWWQPQPFTLAKNLDAVERALDISLQPSITGFYTAQFAGDMMGTYAGHQVSLVQVWSEDDFVRVQENLIGHLVMKRRLKHSPTLFIATTESELEVVSVCNLNGEVIIEQLGTQKRQVISPSIENFLISLQPLSERC
ncbi:MULTISPECIES: SecY-interacting protein [Erwinia]|uniref:Protein Syd n=1 Tax=Erwinia rhapontici TaxID=55212 RepID=A0ABN6DRR4_ERWRD|nr:MULTISPECIES: SecY-interacting protein [Erwinia]MBP2152405.1 SecY interacting protein Syd [Erwinia rhapontici]MCS3609166.1 SecY interacting protein Syd [Erwinia rhapontici]NKG28739.1 SecY-interacting protein [Erwinia rhapontici]NNS09197.1 SecY-interacting protein [Erwinia sp. JH02]UDQ79376.1 SecY-interacting protein [Erwinia rhapontici]